MLPKSNLSKQAIKSWLAKNPNVKTLVRELTPQEFEKTKTKTLIKLLPQGVVKRTPKQYLTTKRKGGATLLDFKELSEEKALILKEKARNFKEKKKIKNQKLVYKKSKEGKKLITTIQAWSLVYNKEERQKNYILNNLKINKNTCYLKAVAMLSTWTKFKPLKLKK